MSKTLHKEYHVLETGMEIRYSVSFNKEKINWATGQPKKIGYQVSATPIERIKGDGYSMESFGAFTGFNDCLLEAERQSSKRLEFAITELKKRIPELYKNWFLNKYPNGKS